MTCRVAFALLFLLMGFGRVAASEEAAIDLTNYQNIKVEAAYRIDAFKYMVKFRAYTGEETPSPSILNSSTLFYCQNHDCFQLLSLGEGSEYRRGLMTALYQAFALFLAKPEEEVEKGKWIFDREQGSSKLICPNKESIDLREFSTSENEKFLTQIQRGEIRLVPLPEYYEPLFLLQDPLLGDFYFLDKQAHRGSGHLRAFVGRPGHMVPMEISQSTYRTSWTHILLKDGRRLTAEPPNAIIGDRTLKLVSNQVTSGDLKVLGISDMLENTTKYRHPCEP